MTTICSHTILGRRPWHTTIAEPGHAMQHRPPGTLTTRALRFVGFVCCLLVALPTSLFALCANAPPFPLQNGAVADAEEVNVILEALQNGNLCIPGHDNTAVGAAALQSPTPGVYNTALGSSALAANYGDDNTAVGYAALTANANGTQNTAVGYVTLMQNSTGSNNTALGAAALYSNTTGWYNTAVGYAALVNTTTGDDNTALGAAALQSTTTGGANTALGYVTLMRNTSGNYNTALGTAALYSTISGNHNTAVGHGALQSNLDGSANTAVGIGAGNALVRGANNIYLGHAGATTESNTMRLGQDQTRTFIAGIAAVPISGSLVLIDNTGQLGIQMSSARYKSDIEAMETRSRRLFQLRPVTFRYTHDAQGERHYGLIAEEVAKVYPELVTHGADGQVESVRYQELTPMLLNELQYQQQQNERLQATVEQLQAQNAAVTARLERLEAAAAGAGHSTSR
jgi:hypothetical protein